MRALVQRVAEASVTVDGRTTGAIAPGLLVLVGVSAEDQETDAEWIAGKLARLRVFPDGDGQMNRSITEAGGDVLMISQFTLLASTRKGNRPSYMAAARPEIAQPLFESCRRRLEQHLGRAVPTGVFGAHMEVRLLNDGPVTLMLDSRNPE